MSNSLGFMTASLSKHHSESVWGSVENQDGGVAGWGLV